jgi:uncharacterized protein (UPF0218 family)
MVYSLKREFREKLRRPFGILIRGTPAATMHELEIFVKRKNPPAIISVGDMVSRNLHEHQIIPQLSITDNKCMREKIEAKIFPEKTLFHVSNPQGTITKEAIVAILESLKSGKETQIVVDGEEDLLTLIAVQHAPEKSFVVYGQPKEGIVVVEVTPDKKAEAMAILEAMKTVRKAK